MWRNHQTKDKHIKLSSTTRGNGTNEYPTGMIIESVEEEGKKIKPPRRQDRKEKLGVSKTILSMSAKRGKINKKDTEIRLQTSPLAASRKVMSREKPPSLPAESNPNVFSLPRGGVVVTTPLGPIQFGIPPETIKDSMDLGMDVPMYFVVPSQRFNKNMGPNCGINVAEFEFPAYMNFFFKRRPICLIVNTVDVEFRIQQVFQETLLGPVEIDRNQDYAPEYPEEMKADLKKEMTYFRKFGDTNISVDMLLKFATFNEFGQVVLSSEDGTKQVTIEQTLTEYILTEGDQEIARVPTVVQLPIPRQPKHSKEAFLPPIFGVTVLGSSHGFDPKGRTSGYVLWVNGRGIMIDPPPNSTILLQQENIPPSLIDAIIVTHCHADHDAGTFQKILQEGKISLYTTKTIIESFLRKYSALSGLDEMFLRQVFSFHQVRIAEPVKVRGATFKFFYTLHSIPCIGFEVFFGGKSIVFSADHMNDPAKIEQLCEVGVVSPGRRDQLLNFPYNHDVILHEAGVPPIHTPIDTLAALPTEIKAKLYVVHASLDSVPTDSGLRVAVTGVKNTIKLHAESPLHSASIEALRLVSSVPIFENLNISLASELLSIAKPQEFRSGEAVVRKGEVGDCFYVIASGVAEVVVARQRATTSGSGSSAALSNTSSRNEANRLRSRSNSSESNSSEGPAHGGNPESTIKFFTTGDYFGEQALLASHRIRSADIFAVTDLRVWRFDVEDCNFLLQETRVLEHLTHLTTTRSEGAWEVMMTNKILRQLSATQKTQLEGFFWKMNFVKGQVIWSKNDLADKAVLIRSGAVKYEGKVNVYRRNSGVRLDLKVRRAPVPPAFRTGAFLGNIDAILSQGKMTTTLVALEDGDMHVIDQNSLLHFFQSNPGVLLSLLHTHFVNAV